MSTMKLKSFDRVAAIYDETRSAPPEIAAAVTRALLDALRGVAPSPRLLEVGIGTGRIAVPLAEAGVRVTGIDISLAMLSVLRSKRRDIDVMLAEAAHPPLRDASFDAALFSHVLHLVPDLVATVEAMIGIVRDRGILIHLREDHDEGKEHVRGGEITWDVLEELTGVERPGDGHAQGVAAFKRVASSHGWGVEDRLVTRYPAPFNPRRALDMMRGRVNSSSWLIPDDAMDAVAAEVERRFLAEWGDLDADREAYRNVRLATARRA
jgi:SAM-dependent methyltransferase